MAFLIDKATRQYWKYYGKGLTDDISKACNYPDSVAIVLVKLDWENTAAVRTASDGQMTLIEHTPDKTSRSPLVNENMKKNGLVWVGYENSWMAVPKQALALGTLIAFNMPKVTG